MKGFLVLKTITKCILIFFYIGVKNVCYFTSVVWNFTPFHASFTPVVWNFTPFHASGVKFHNSGVKWRTRFTPSYFPPDKNNTFTRKYGENIKTNKNIFSIIKMLIVEKDIINYYYFYLSIIFFDILKEFYNF